MSSRTGMSSRRWIVVYLKWESHYGRITYTEGFLGESKSVIAPSSIELSSNPTYPGMSLRILYVFCFPECKFLDLSFSINDRSKSAFHCWITRKCINSWESVVLKTCKVFGYPVRLKNFANNFSGLEYFGIGHLEKPEGIGNILVWYLEMLM